MSAACLREGGIGARGSDYFPSLSAARAEELEEQE